MGLFCSARRFKHLVADPGQYGNAVFASDAVLCESADNLPESSALLAKAELLARHYLCPYKPDRKPFAILQDWLEQDALTDFLQDLHDREGWDQDISESCKRLEFLVDGGISSLPPQAARAITRRFRSLFAADGFIPVAVLGTDGQEDEAYLLPFTFSQNANLEDKPPRVLDADSREIPQWTSSLRKVPSFWNRDVIVDINTSMERFPSLEGDSFLLPVFLAWKRKNEPERFPAISPLRFFATGDFSNYRLKAVDGVVAKRNKIRESIQNGLLLFPMAANAEKLPPMVARPIPENADESAILELVREYAEEAFEANTKYAANCLGKWSAKVSTNNHANWKSVETRILNITSNLDPTVNPAHWIQWMMVRAIVYSNAGWTDKALELTQDLLSFTQKHPEYTAYQLRIRIEQIVLYQDKDELDELVKFIPQLEKDLEAYCQDNGRDKSAFDLRMRFHGTMGQVESCIALHSGNAEKISKAKQHFDCAFQCASRLDVNNALAWYELVKVSNFILLWHAYFQPEEMSEPYSNAAKRAKKCLEDFQDEDGKTNNDYFRLREGLLGLYRMVLQGKKPALPSFLRPTSAFLESSGWIGATGGKYLGAIEAAQGNPEKAAKRFASAAKILTNGNNEILQMIHMTICAEAFRSLSPFSEYWDMAEEYRLKALAFFDGGRIVNDIRRPWKDWLEHPTANSFPGLRYWY